MIRARHIAGALAPVGRPAEEWLAANVGPGEVVYVTIEHARSPATHKHQWAWLHDAWASLPEAVLGEAYAATPETLRKHALIATGFSNVTQVDCGTKASAARVGASLLAAETRACGYAVGQVRGPVVRVWTPESQSMRAMGATRFQASKTAVLDWVAKLLDVPADTLAKADAA